jgi:hypothetical protein
MLEKFELKNIKDFLKKNYHLKIIKQAQKTIILL